jgi:hypothetical protein
MTLIPVFADFLWSPETKRLYYDDLTPVGPSTYERALWKSPWYQFWIADRYLNPLDYPTLETARKVLDWARKVAGLGIDFSLVEDKEVRGSISHPQIYLVATANGRSETFGSGRLAFGIDKNGPRAAERSFVAELQLAGFPILTVG